MKGTASILAAVVAAVTLSACGAATDGVVSEPTLENTQTSAPAKSTAAKPKPAAPKLTKEQENAKRSAEMYLETMGFSYKGLIRQLTQTEGYSKADAVAGIKALGKINWNAEAQESAEQYLATMPFSKKELINQLVQIEGFTKAQAQYAVEKAL